MKPAEDKAAALKSSGWPVLAVLLCFGLGVLTPVLLEFSADYASARRRRPGEFLTLLDQAATDPVATRGFLREAAGADYELKDYGLWRSRPFRGKYFNIDEEGLRRTVDPVPERASARPISIYMFGGSTMWGFGARDEATIASQVSNALAREGFPVEVKNYGELAYVNSQEVAALIGELQKGARPDVVIFFDGLNDVLAAFLARPGDATFSDRWVEIRDEVSAHGRSPWGRLSLLLSRSALVRTFSRKTSAAPPPRKSDEALAEDVAGRYIANVGIVESIAGRFHFKPIYYWQPVMAKKKRLTDIERGMRRFGEYDPSMAPVFDLVSTKVDRAEAATPGLHNIIGLLSEESGTAYLDGEHYTEAANRKIALRIAADVVRELRARGARASERP